MLPLYLARVGDLEQGDFVKIDCAACHHVALMTPAALLKLGLSPVAKVLDLTLRVRCRACGVRGRAAVSVKWGCQSG
jgi:ribosomal protein S27E